MPTTLNAVISNYVRAANLAQGTKAEYQTTLSNWKQWGNGVPLEKQSRKEIREFLDWVHEQAVTDNGTIPGRTTNKARAHLRAIVAWAWDQDLIDSLPRFPKPKEQRDVAGRHYLTKEELNALYFSTYQIKRPRGWSEPYSIGRYWRCALVLFYNYGVDTGTIWQSTPCHEPILWRHVSWDKQSPDRDVKQQSPWGWLFYKRVKTGKTFYRPMNRVVHSHLKSIAPECPLPDSPVCLGGGCRPNARFEELCKLAGIKHKFDVESGKEEPWELKDLRKACAIYYDEHMPEL